MIIRSQDKLQLIPLETGSISVDYRNKKKINFFETGNNNPNKIGEYSSEEKAIKVLDEICNQYGRYTCRYGGDHSIDAVYQMPQDSEVE